MAEDGDWTWVLDRACHECGFVADALDAGELGARFRAVGGAWREMLGRGAALHQLRDGDDRTWTPLQYGCHVRDVLDLMEDRTRMMLKKRKPPTFKDWDQEAEAVSSRYADQDPAKVAYTLASRAGKYADLLDRINAEEWSRKGIRSDGPEFTVESLARYALHDVEHHLWDVQEQLDG